MKKIIVAGILASFLLPMPVHAAATAEPMPMEQGSSLLSQPADEPGAKDTKPAALEGQRMQDDFTRDIKKPEQLKTEEGKKKTTWWKWALGAVIVGGIAAAASGHGKGNGSSGNNSTGDISASW